MGTILTHLVEKEPNLKLPKALILEGVVNAPVSIHQYYEAHFKSYREVVKKHPEIEKMFAVDLPLGQIMPLRASPEAWGDYLFNIGNDFQHSVSQLLGMNEEILKKSSSRPASDSLNKILQVRKDQLSKMKSIPWKERMYKDLGCHEIYQGWGPISGMLSASGSLFMHRLTRKATCEGGKLLDRPFKSEKYKLKTAIHYFHGTHDPVAPHEEALKHFNSQNEGEQKFFNTVKYAGHHLSTRDRFMKNCWLDILVRIAKGKAYKDLLSEDGHCLNAT